MARLVSEGKCTLSNRLALAVVMGLLAAPATAQESANQELPLNLPPISGFAPVLPEGPLATAAEQEVTLSAQLTSESPELTRGVIWRIFSPEAGDDGKLPLVAARQGGTNIFMLRPGSYLVHAAFGRAGATKRITVGQEQREENFVLDAGGLKLDATLSGGLRIPPSKLKFSIYEAAENSEGERPLIAPNVSPNSVVRLNAGVYHVVSTYGNVNAVIRSDIRVEAGKLTEATVEHRAAQLNLKLVRAKGGEAIADTSWTILTDSGDLVRETVGPFASMVLAEGDYTVVARNRDRIYQRDFTVEPARNQEVEVITSEDTAENRAAEASSREITE